MIGVYLGALAFGGILIGVSVLLGGGDGDVDKDFDFGADIDADADADFDVEGDFDKSFDLSSAAGDAADAALWLPFLSLRFWTFGAAGFGMVGAMLHYTTSATIALVLAILVGLTSGTTTAWAFKKLKQDTVSSDVGLTRFVGVEARVLLPVYPGDMGKIVIDAAEGQLELVARTGDATGIDRGARVLITEVVDGAANVTSIPSLPSGQQTGLTDRTQS